MTPALADFLSTQASHYAEAHPRATVRVHLSDSLVVNRPASALGVPALIESELDFLEIRTASDGLMYRIDTAAALRRAQRRSPHTYDGMLALYQAEAWTANFRHRLWLDRAQWLDIWRTSTSLQATAFGLGGMLGPALVGIMALVVGTHTDIYASQWDTMLYVYANREQFGL